MHPINDRFQYQINSLRSISAACTSTITNICNSSTTKEENGLEKKRKKQTNKRTNKTKQNKRATTGGQYK